MSGISLQFESFLHYLSTTDCSIRGCIVYLTVVLAKLTNTGFVVVDLNITRSIPAAASDFFSLIFSPLIKAVLELHQGNGLRSQSERYSRLWRAAISSLPPSEIKKVIASFLAHLQRRVWLDESLELSVDHEAFGIEEAGAAMLFFYLEDSLEDDQSECVMISDAVIEVVTKYEGWSIATARFLARWARMSRDPKGVRERLAKQALHSFAHKHQIAYGSSPHHIFLLVLLLLTSSPVPSESHSSSLGPQVDILADLVFVKALELSLGSIRRQFRLLGMLMAEMITSFHGPVDKVAKLDFGAEVWSVDDDETRLCEKIRHLVQKWVDPCNNLSSQAHWLNVLYQLIQDRRSEISVDVSANSKPVVGHNGRSQSESSDRFQMPSNPNCQATPKRAALETFPPDLLQGLGSCKTEAPQSKIEVLHDPNQDDDEFEPYEILPEDATQPSVLLKNAPTPGLGESYEPPSKKIRQPVFLSELTEFLKNHDSVEHIELGLKEAGPLIRKKKGWGTELYERALDLTFALLCLQDNYDLDNFETYRQDGLVGLVVSVPEKVAPCLIEQAFFSQYSFTQRVCMLNSLVLGAKELLAVQEVPSGGIFPSRKLPSAELHRNLLRHQAGGNGREYFEEDFLPDLSSRIAHDNLGRTLKADERNLKVLSVSSARQDGQVVRVSRSLEKTRKRTELSSPARASASLMTHSHGKLIKFNEWFLIPLVHQIWNYLNRSHQMNLTTRATSNKNKTSLGRGFSIVNEPLISSRLISSLTILLDYRLKFISDNSNPQSSCAVTVLDLNLIQEILSIGLRLKNELLLATEQEESEIGNLSIEIRLLELVLISLDCLINFHRRRVNFMKRGFEWSPVLKAIVEWCEGLLNEQLDFAHENPRLQPQHREMPLKHLLNVGRRHHDSSSRSGRHRLAIEVLRRVAAILE